MKKTMMRFAAVAALMLLAGSQVQAQGFLKKLGKVASAVSSTKTDTSAEQAESNDSVVKPNWAALPTYTVKEVTQTDNEGKPVLNEDGTPLLTYKLFDQNGNMRSEETVAAQQKKINKAITRILLKVGGGAALGVAGGLLASKGKAGGGIIGGLAGAAAGLALSKNDIKEAKAQKKSLKEQEKMLEAYRQTFTAEGTPKDASVDLTNVDGINFKKESVSMTAENYKAAVSSPDYSDTSWEVPTI